MKQLYLLTVLLLLLTQASTLMSSGSTESTDYHRARWDPIHFPPQITSATDEQCLACHQEVLQDKVLNASPAGVAADQTLAWYQTLTTYKGPQKTFHQRHLTTPLAKQLMDMKCITCHQGNDPREEAPIPPDISQTSFTLRKQVNPKTCLMCHGSSPYKIMGLPSPWEESRELFQDSCLLCHVSIRTTRHQVNYLKADAIEKAGKEDSDTCFGCHGGRQWYRISYPYPRHAWKGMADTVPEWAKDRPTESNPRFQIPQKQAKN